jgi:hypothetical protein
MSLAGAPPLGGGRSSSVSGSLARRTADEFDDEFERVLEAPARAAPPGACAACGRRAAGELGRVRARARRE